VTEFTRADDERHLAWIILAEKGQSATQIARAYRATKGTVIGMLRRIRLADEHEEGKPV
jgi:transposase